MEYWKFKAIDKLKDYTAQKASTQNLCEKKKISLLDMASNEAIRLGMSYERFVAIAEEKFGGVAEYFRKQRGDPVECAPAVPPLVRTYVNGRTINCRYCGREFKQSPHFRFLCSAECQAAQAREREYSRRKRLAGAMEV